MIHDFPRIDFDHLWPCQTWFLAHRFWPSVDVEKTKGPPLHALVLSAQNLSRQKHGSYHICCDSVCQTTALPSTILFHKRLAFLQLQTLITRSILVRFQKFKILQNSVSKSILECTRSLSWLIYFGNCVCLGLTQVTLSFKQKLKVMLNLLSVIG